MIDQDVQAIVDELVSVAELEALACTEDEGRLHDLVVRAEQYKDVPVLKIALNRLGDTDGAMALRQATADYVECRRGCWSSGQEYVARLYLIPLMFSDAQVLPESIDASAVAEILTEYADIPSEPVVVVAPTLYSFSEVDLQLHEGSVLHASLLNDDSIGTQEGPEELGFESWELRAERPQRTHRTNLRFVIASIAVPADERDVLPNDAIGISLSTEALNAEADKALPFGTDAALAMTETLADSDFEEAIQQAVDARKPYSPGKSVPEVRAAMPMQTGVYTGRFLYDVGTILYLAKNAPPHAERAVLTPPALGLELVGLAVSVHSRETSEGLSTVTHFRFENNTPLPDLLDWFHKLLPLAAPNLRVAWEDEGSDEVSEVAEALRNKAARVAQGIEDEGELVSVVMNLLEAEGDRTVHNALREFYERSCEGEDCTGYEPLEAVAHAVAESREVDIGGRSCQARLSALPVWFALETEIPSTLPAEVITQKLNEYGILAPDVTFLATPTLYRQAQLRQLSLDDYRTMHAQLLSGGAVGETPSLYPHRESSVAPGIGLRYLVGTVIAPVERPNDTTRHLDLLPSGTQPLAPVFKSWFDDFTRELAGYIGPVNGDIRPSVPQPLGSARKGGVWLHTSLISREIKLRMPPGTQRVSVTVAEESGEGRCDIESSSQTHSFHFEWPVDDSLQKALDDLLRAVKEGAPGVEVTRHID